MSSVVVRPHHGLLIAAVVAVTLVACTANDDTTDPNGLSTTSDHSPDVTTVSPVTTSAEADIDLQRRAFERMCRDVVCSGRPILAPSSTPADLRSELAESTDEIEYVSTSDLADWAEADGRFRGGAVLIGIEGIHATERPDVRGVDVSISRGIHDYFQRTYLFRWNDSGWIDTTPDEVDVAVVTAVS